MNENNGNESSDLFTRKWLLIVIVCVLPAFGLFAYFGDPGRGRAAAGATAVIMYAAKANRDLTNYVWFWITLVVIILLHGALVFLIPWTSKSYPGLILLPVAVLDYAVVYGCVKLAEKILKRA